MRAKAGASESESLSGWIAGPTAIIACRWVVVRGRVVARGRRLMRRHDLAGIWAVLQCYSDLKQVATLHCNLRALTFVIRSAAMGSVSTAATRRGSRRIKSTATCHPALGSEHFDKLAAGFKVLPSLCITSPVTAAQRFERVHIPVDRAQDSDIPPFCHGSTSWFWIPGPHKGLLSSFDSFQGPYLQVSIPLLRQVARSQSLCRVRDCSGAKNRHGTARKDANDM